MTMEKYARRNGICIDVVFYKKTYSDLQCLTDDEAANHFAVFGEAEGRECAVLSRRKSLIEHAGVSNNILELGPFTNPSLIGESVKYFDVLDKEGLNARAIEHGLPTGAIPKIDYVSPFGDLSVVDKKFDTVFSCHNIEHQVDLIAHLNDVAKILKGAGKYYLIIPDKRFCFDHFIAVSSLADVIYANWDDENCSGSKYKGKRRHSIKSMIENYALTTHNDCNEHWNGNHGEISLETVIERTGQAIDAYRKSDSQYIDVHAWRFTPRSFSKILYSLAALNLSPFKDICVFATPRNQIEFTAILGL